MGGGKKNSKRASFARRTIDADCALMRIDNTQGCCQAQASSGKLGREKRIKDPGCCLFVHSTAVVVNFDMDVFSWCQNFPGEGVPDINRVQVLYSCPDRHGS